MIDILFAKTFFIVGSMLCLTAVTAKYNRYFETAYEAWATILITFLLLFLIFGFSETYPLNLIIVAAFALVMGWMIGPTIEIIGENFQLRKYLRDKGEPLESGKVATPEQIAEFKSAFDVSHYHKQWQNIIFQAVLGTALAVLLAASLVFLTNIDFGFLEGFLFISLVILLIMSALNAFVFRSRFLLLLRAYAGAILFSLYLLFDFGRLKKSAGDDSWSTAIELSVAIYIDIINLFIDLLIILAESQ